MPVQSQSDWKKKSKARISQPRDPTTPRGGTTVRPAEKCSDVLRVEMSAKANLPLAQTPPPTWSDARHTMWPVQFTIFHNLLPYPSGRAAAHHNRTGIGPMLVASDRRRPVTGQPRQVHRIRALVCVYYTTIQIILLCLVYDIWLFKISQEGRWLRLSAICGEGIFC